MDFSEIILKRRSIRKYRDKKVEREKITAILKAGMYAPSAVNKQPWHFIVVDDKALMNKIMDVHPNAKMLSTASHAILVCGEEKRQYDDGYWIAVCGAVTENILLEATALGLGSCWIGVYPREKRMKALKEMFGLPVHIQPFAIVSLGYPDEEKRTPDRYDPDKVFLNSWSNPW